MSPANHKGTFVVLSKITSSPLEYFKDLVKPSDI